MTLLIYFHVIYYNTSFLKFINILVIYAFEITYGWLHQSLWLCGSQQTGKFFKIWEYQTTLPASWETCMQVKKQQLEWDMEQQTGSNLGKEYVKAVYCHTAYLTYMQRTSCEMLSWKNHKLESRLPGEISITSGMQMAPQLWQKEKRNWRTS